MKISVIVCTYNGENLIEGCLDSILSQRFKDYEILCIDGMSSDNTLGIVKNYQKRNKNIRLMANEKRLPEGYGNGKWKAFKLARGEIICIIDQDNVLQDRDLFSKAVSSLKKKNILGVLGGLKHDLKDSPIVRFVSIFGTDGFMAYRSVDFVRNFSKSNVLNMNADNMLITGGNCFFYRKKDVDGVGGYDQDVLVIKRLLEGGKKKLLILENSTKHYAERSLFSLMIKKFRWGKAYFERKEKFDYFPKTSKERQEFIKNGLSCFFIIPNFWIPFKLFSSFKDPIVFAFPFFAFMNGMAYGINFIRSRIQ